MVVRSDFETFPAKTDRSPRVNLVWLAEANLEYLAITRRCRKNIGSMGVSTRSGFLLKVYFILFVHNPMLLFPSEGPRSGEKVYKKHTSFSRRFLGHCGQLSETCRSCCFSEIFSLQVYVVMIQTQSDLVAYER